MERYFGRERRMGFLLITSFVNTKLYRGKGPDVRGALDPDPKVSRNFESRIVYELFKTSCST